MLHPFIVALALTMACSRNPLPSEPPAVAVSSVAAATSESGLSGKVAEKIDASQYSYLRLETPSGEIWAAVPKSKIEVGAQATVLGASWMESFTSATLSRTWPRIAFGTLAGEAQAAPGMGASPGAGQASAGMFAQEAAQVFPSQSPQTKAPPSPPGGFALPKVATREGRTIAELYARRAVLKDKRVSVRGKVVKATDGVLGKNWLHLQDGTGSGPTGDLAVTSDSTAKVGDVVVVTGMMHLDRDLGSGYRYDILLEDAELKKE